MDMNRIHGVNEIIPLLRLSSDGIMRHDFQVWLPDDIIGLKLEGFISEFATKVVKVSPNVVKIRVGKRSWLPLNRYEYDVPFDIAVRFQPGRKDVSLTRVEVELKPLTRTVADGIVKARATSLMRTLRGCLMVEQEYPEDHDPYVTFVPPVE